jgi:methionine-gamma-lyase
MQKPNKGYRHRSIGNRQLTPETLMMGYGYDPQLSEGAVKCPIFQTSTFVFKSAEEGKAFFEVAFGLRELPPTEEPGLIYSRLNNPDLQILEDRLTLWEKAEAALVFSSGMSAISTTLLTFLRPGDVILCSQPVYGGTAFLLDTIFPQFQIHTVGFRAGSNTRIALEEAARRASQLGRPAAIFVETPANPTIELVDIAACVSFAESLSEDPSRRPLVIVDNTFLGPLWQHPLDHGADLVVYSLTKYVGGHSDLIAGACLGAERHIGSVRGMRTVLGTMCDPQTGWLLMRSLETLKLRVIRATENAGKVAAFLKEHPKVRTVRYLGFLCGEDPQREVCSRQCKAFGSTFSFDIHGGEEEAFRVLDSLQHIKLAVSLGGTESLMEHPATMTHSEIPAEERMRIGISPSMLRISVGIEDPDDLIADLSQALNAI